MQKVMIHIKVIHSTSDGYGVVLIIIVDTRDVTPFIDTHQITKTALNTQYI